MPLRYIVHTLLVMHVCVCVWGGGGGIVCVWMYGCMGVFIYSSDFAMAYSVEF